MAFAILYGLLLLVLFADLLGALAMEILELGVRLEESSGAVIAEDLGGGLDLALFWFEALLDGEGFGGVDVDVLRLGDGDVGLGGDLGIGRYFFHLNYIKHFYTTQQNTSILLLSCCPNQPLLEAADSPTLDIYLIIPQICIPSLLFCRCRHWILKTFNAYIFKYDYWWPMR